MKHLDKHNKSLEKKIVKQKKINEYKEEFIEHKRKLMNDASKNNKQDKLKQEYQKFMRKKSIGPDQVCFCCQGLFFPRQVVPFNDNTREDLIKTFDEKFAKQNTQQQCEYEEEYDVDMEPKISNSLIDNYNSYHLCKTCLKHTNEVKLPPLAAVPNIAFPEVPDCIKKLNELERIMCSPYIL